MAEPQTSEQESFANDTPFHAYALALLHHHRLETEGEENHLQLEVIEDRMSELWDKLDEAQQNELRGIGSDLNWLWRSCLLAQKGRRKEDVTQADLERFHAANEAGDFLPLLHAVRDCAPVLTNEVIALCRARCYAGLGLPEIGDPFLKVAIGLALSRSDLRALQKVIME